VQREGEPGDRQARRRPLPVEPGHHRRGGFGGIEGATAGVAF